MTKNSIAFRLFIAVFLASLTMTLLITAVRAWFDYKMVTTDIENQLKRIEIIYLPVIKENLWDMDEKTVKTAMQGLLNIPHVKRIVIEDRDKMIMKVGSIKTEHLLQREFPLLYTYGDKTRLLGVLKIDIAIGEAYKELWGNVKVGLLYTLILVFLVTFSIYFVFQMLVTRHLFDIVSYLKQVKIDSLEKRLFLKRRRSASENPDEIDQIVFAINSMQARLIKNIEVSKQAKEELHILSQLNKSIVDSSPFGILIFNPAGDCIVANDAAAEGVGATKAQVLRQNYHHLDSWKKSGLYDMAQHAMQEKTEKSHEINVKTSFGKECSLDIHMVPLSKGNETHLLLMFDDITERKQVAEELDKYKVHLEELVEKRTEELKGKAGKIEESRKALTYLLEDVNMSREALQIVNLEYAAANQELKEFSYIVSHDLKAPLRAISQLTHWLSEDYSAAFDDDGRQQMALIMQRVKRMDGLIDGVLRYSRIGRVKEKEERLDLNLLVNKVIENLAPPDNIQIILENSLPVVLRDPTRMGQVFQNLIGNAIKFMDKDAGVIKVSCVDEGELWKFRVADNGPGIDKRYHDKIFQIFQTLKARDEHESTGIGLTLVKKIITLFGGSIQVESERGKGSAFIFTLPKK